MNILSAEEITKSYSEKILLDRISLGIDQKDKIGVIGVNGTGKSTLLKILAGVESLDSGKIMTVNGLQVGYLDQNPVFEDGSTVLQQVFYGNSPAMILLREYEALLHKVNINSEDENSHKRLTALISKMDAQNVWNLESDAKAILQKLGVSDYDAEISILSGGQRKRVAMARALINPTDLLILDEPTNHIDNDAVDWLEKYLNARKGALMMVTHDRYFLERVANRIIELDNGKLYSYQANYSKYLELKAEREELEQAGERKRQGLLRSELEWIRRGARARTTKQKARIDRFEKLQAVQAPDENEAVEIKALSSRLGKKIIEINHLSKRFGELPIVSDFSYLLSRDDRIGIIGPNGIGKSTFLKLLTGLLEPDSGEVDIGATVKIGYFGQESSSMDHSLRVIDYIRQEAEYVETSEGPLSASQMLEQFLFPPSVQWTPIAKLSGGEKRRLYLLRILMGAPNILLLDEPTNDLDIQTLMVLENYLDDFPGAVIMVSHDRWFLDRMAEKLLVFEGNGAVRQYNGNYSYYREIVESERALEPAPQASQKKQQANEKQDAENKKSKPLKFSFKEQKEFETIDAVIAGLEENLKKAKLDMEASSSDYTRLQELISYEKELEEKLENAMERWTYLYTLAEEIEKQKTLSR